MIFRWRIRKENAQSQVALDLTYGGNEMSDKLMTRKQLKLFEAQMGRDDTVFGGHNA